jgi:hypothetical protein
MKRLKADKNLRRLSGTRTDPPLAAYRPTPWMTLSIVAACDSECRHLSLSFWKARHPHEPLDRREVAPLPSACHFWHHSMSC